MQTRLAIFILVVIALAGFFGVRRAFDDRSGAPQPDAAASRRSTAAAQIQLLEQTARDRPNDGHALTALASAYVQRARETGDPSSYGLAEASITRALAEDADDVNAVVVAGTVALALHDFEHALELGERARALNPDVVAAYAVTTDAFVELGRYDQALAFAQEMIDRRPDFLSYSRVSYLRELHGDIEGAIEAMEQAAAAGAGLGFDEAWARVIIGNLYLQQGDLAAAEASYRTADRVLPSDALTQAALGRLAIAQGNYPEAEALLRSAVEQRPLPEYAIALGDLLWSQGRTSESEEQYALVRATQQLFAANGVDTDIELALFDADHGVDPERTYATALAAYQRRPSVFAADTVAWAAFKSGRIEEALRYSAEAMRIGTQDARLAYHAGVIAHASGDDDAAALHLRAAVAMEPAQSLLYAAAARDALEKLTAEAAH